MTRRTPGTRLTREQLAQLPHIELRGIVSPAGFPTADLAVGRRDLRVTLRYQLGGGKQKGSGTIRLRVTHLQESRTGRMLQRRQFRLAATVESENDCLAVGATTEGLIDLHWRGQLACLTEGS